MTRSGTGCRPAVAARSSPARVLGALLLDLHRAGHSVPLPEFRRFALHRIRQDIPFDAALWVCAVHPGPSIPEFNDFLIVNRPHDLMREYEKVKHHDHLVQQNMANNGQAIMSNSLASQPGVPAPLLDYADQFQIDHALAIHTRDPLTGLSSAIALWRTPDDAPFREKDRLLLELACPHLIESYDKCRVMHLEHASNPKRRATVSCGVVDKSGLLHLARPDLAQRLLSEFPSWRGPQLPEALRAILATAPGERFIGDKFVFAATPVDDLYLMQCWTKRPADLLTSRELEIAQLCVDGLTYKEIARTLLIAPGTVRNQISAVLAKLKLRKQSEIATALYGLFQVGG